MDLDAIKKQIPILDVARWLGIQVNAQNKAQCPNTGGHRRGDQHPSLSFDLKNNKCHCFSCGEGGSTIDIVMLCRGYGEQDAVKAIQELSDHFLGNSKPAKKHTPNPPKPARTYTLAQIKNLKMGDKRQQRFDKLYNYGKSYFRVCYRNPEDRNDKSYRPFTPIGVDKYVM